MEGIGGVFREVLDHVSDAVVLHPGHAFDRFALPPSVFLPTSCCGGCVSLLLTAGRVGSRTAAGHFHEYDRDCF